MIVMRVPVPYEFQNGRNEMLRIIASSTEAAVPLR